VRGWGTVDVGVDQHVVVEPVDRVVQRRGVEAELDAGGADCVPKVHQAQPDPSGQAITNLFFLSPPTHRLRVRIPQSEADLGALLGLVRKQLGDLRVAVRQEQPGEDQHVDAVGGAVQQAPPQRSGYGPAVGVEGDQLGGAGRLGSLVVGDLGPQVGLVGPKQRGGRPAM
jgi:hypothetical protein